MYDADVVIVACSKTPELQQMTQRCLDSLYKSEPDLSLQVLLVETGPATRYDGQHRYLLAEPGELNYNRWLNQGVAAGTSEIVACCNNDLLFKPGWLSSNLQVFADRLDIASLGSLSAVCDQHRRFGPGLHFGWTVSEEFSGWCFTLRRSVWRQIGQLSEQYQFYGSDNILVRQLQQGGFKHALNAASHVWHLISRSHGLLTAAEHAAVTVTEMQQFHQDSRRMAYGPVPPNTGYGVAGCP